MQKEYSWHDIPRAKNDYVPVEGDVIGELDQNNNLINLFFVQEYFDNIIKGYYIKKPVKNGKYNDYITYNKKDYVKAFSTYIESNENN